MLRLASKPVTRGAPCAMIALNSTVPAVEGRPLLSAVGRNLCIETNGGLPMAGPKSSERMPDIAYRVFMWFCWLVELLHSARHRVKKMPVGEGMVVVDYGCGPGRYAIPLAKAVGPDGRVIAVDIHRLAIEATDKRAARESIANLETVLVDGYDTGIEDMTADLVLLLDAFHMIADREALLREIRRILKDDGTLFMDPGHMKLSAALGIVEGTGLFIVTECRGHDMWLAPAPRE